ncbi:hypothetical protein AZ78_5021 [Lysobacter capsici AZ78]|uniref:Uncharacterized protein n=1 Tax=Lysobacter capsici AZ78 TaxID=1444315 RepID=A0A108U4E9_9GAMM|nr:hypothetical protein AZ78_5021 [Lysobacter capsici AZ78]
MGCGGAGRGSGRGIVHGGGHPGRGAGKNRTRSCVFDSSTILAQVSSDATHDDRGTARRRHRINPSRLSFFLAKTRLCTVFRRSTVSQATLSTQTFHPFSPPMKHLACGPA